jgi:hypothetical protein
MGSARTIRHAPLCGRPSSCRTYAPLPLCIDIVALVGAPCHSRQVLKRLETDKQGVQSEFEEFRRLLCDPRNIRVQVIVDVSTLPLHRSTWRIFCSTHSLLFSLLSVA